MAHTRFEYVRKFEQVSEDVCLLNTFMVVRVDGRAFSNFTKNHNMVKPNDPRALAVMNDAAATVVKQFPEIILAYGQSDEFSFAFRRDAKEFKRRRNKILSLLVSMFSAAYVFYWPQHFPQTPLQTIPHFDARIVLYPSKENLKDYFRWRQADCHINNLYNTTFWALVDKGEMSPTEAEAFLKDTVSKDKHEALFTRFGTNYNDEPAQYKKGSIILRKSGHETEGGFAIVHLDMMKDDFWSALPL